MNYSYYTETASAMQSQDREIAPADKKLYYIRIKNNVKKWR
jgi:thymidine phosphorylase